MNKFHLSLAAFLLCAMVSSSPAFAATIYPYSPSEALANFESSYKPLYDQINLDLRGVSKKAAAWSSTYALQKFEINWADGTENSYKFTFIDVNNYEKALLFIPVQSGGFNQSEITRSADMAYGIYSIPMRLRNLVSAMKTDRVLMSELDSFIKEGCNTSLHITLKKGLSGKLIWVSDFLTANESATKSLVCESYRVTVSAESAASPFFSVQQLK